MTGRDRVAWRISRTSQAAHRRVNEPGAVTNPLKLDLDLVCCALLSPSTLKVPPPQFLGARTGTESQAILKVGVPKRVWPGERFSSRICPALVPSEADFSWLALQTDEYSIPHR